MLVAGQKSFRDKFLHLGLNLDGFTVQVGVFFILNLA